MNLDYLKTEIIPQREREIKEGKNLATAQPIYVVLDLQENICSGHSAYDITTNYKEKKQEYGYIDNAIDTEGREFRKNDWGMESPEEVTRYYTDRIIAFFLTSKAAHDYLEYQSHNLTNSYVYVFYSGYRNKEMDALLNGK